MRKLIGGVLVALLGIVLSAHAVGPLTNGSAAARYHSASSSSGGASLTDGGTWTVEGTGFGTNVSASNQVYECDSLEAESNGTALTASILGSSDWTKAGAHDQLIDSTDSVNCDRSIYNEFQTSADGGIDRYQFGFQRNLTPTTYDALYIEGYIKLTDLGNTGTNGQVKTWRFGENVPDGLEDNDGANVFVQFFNAAFLCNLVVNNANAQDSGNTNFDDGGESLLQRNVWTRVQFMLVPGTANGADGTAQILSVRTDTNAAICTDTRTGRTFRGAGDGEYDRITFQFYIGNTGLQFDGVNVRLDGAFYAVYNDANTTHPKFVWFCNKSTWAAVTADSDTVCVVQVFATWSDTSITGTFNQGQLAGLTAGTHFWAYVLTDIDTPVNSSGIVPTTWLIRDAANDPFHLIDVARAA